jgi:two-component system, NtrC family, nitrogen regulation sensor histidine kinase NtrY
MFIKSYKFRLVVRVLLLAGTLIVFASIVSKKDFLFVTIAVALLVVYQIYLLIHLAEKTNRDLSRFLHSIRYDDTSQTFTSEGLGRSFSELNEAFNQVVRKLQDARSEMEVHARYLNTIIQHVGIGLLVYKPDGAIILINNAAKKLLKVPGLSDINSIKQTSPEFVDTLLLLKHGDKRLVKFHREGETGYLSIFARTFLLREEKHILISIQNIQAELEEKEMEAWQNLIKVLTHEIMNSITPISSMTATLLDMLRTDKANDDLAGSKLDREEIEEMAGALMTIHQRSQGLMTFVNSYRNMTLIPKPRFKLLSVSDFFRRVEKLMNHKLTGDGISFRWSVEPSTLELTADPDLMEQVLINLLLNAIHAVAGRKNPWITLSASLNPEGKITITVEDNGIGIVEEALEKIFIPFFTTKRQGSGIGLSLSRQILRLHNASISAKSVPDEGTVFTIRFG